MQRKRETKTQFPFQQKCEPSVEPPYEIIEFPSTQHQQYSNTIPFQGTKKSADANAQIARKCDLCGCSNAQFCCDLCVQQAFCVSCDQMYHRHPKRQTHVRKRIQQNLRNHGGYEPPLPPKGELNHAPVPPPRRNKRANRLGISSPKPQGTIKKNGSLMGSLKRFVGGMQNTTPQRRITNPCIGARNEMKWPRFTPPASHQLDFDQRSASKDSGYLDWDTDSRQHRAGSFSAFNGPAPAFSSLAQAQSMAQLNCPSCHIHPMPTWDWNRSQMNLNAFPPWTPLATGNPWHGSMMFPGSYRMPGSDSDSIIRQCGGGSFRGARVTRRPRKYESDDRSVDTSDDDDRGKSRKHMSPTLRTVSPALSRRSRRTAITDDDEDGDDSHDEIASKKSDRRYTKRRTAPLPQDLSPAQSRRSYRAGGRKDDDAMSIRSNGSRRTAVVPKSPAPHKSFQPKNAVPAHTSSDSDDELTSERDGDVETSAKYGREIPTRGQSNYQKWEKSKRKPVAGENESSSPKVPRENAATGDWECEHCTYLNAAKSKVCDVCCKSRVQQTTKMTTHIEEEKIDDSETLAESMKNVTMDDKDKEKCIDAGDTKRTETTPRKTISTGTSPPPQTISTQTYDVSAQGEKRNRSFSCDDYGDWNPAKRLNSVTSSNSDQQSLGAKQDDTLPSTEYIHTLLQNHVRHGAEIVKLLKEAEEHHFELEDVTAALAQCGDADPIKWLLENWSKMIDTVVTLATNYGREQAENIIGTISLIEALTALRIHNGDIWAAATECIRQRQRKFTELMSSGNFSREDVVTVLTANHGNLDSAYAELSKTQLKPFLMRIWGPPQGLDNDSGDISRLRRTKSEASYASEESSYNEHDNFGRVRGWLGEARGRNGDSGDKITAQCDPFPSRNRTYVSRHNSCDNLNILRRNDVKKSFHSSTASIPRLDTSPEFYYHVDDEFKIRNYLAHQYAAGYFDYENDVDYDSYDEDGEDDSSHHRLYIDSGLNDGDREEIQFSSSLAFETPVKYLSSLQISLTSPTNIPIDGRDDTNGSSSPLLRNLPDTESSSVQFNAEAPLENSRQPIETDCEPIDNESSILWAELNALRMLTRLQLDAHLIERKDLTENPTFFKKYIVGERSPSPVDHASSDANGNEDAVHNEEEFEEPIESNVSDESAQADGIAQYLEPDPITPFGDKNSKSTDLILPPLRQFYKEDANFTLYEVKSHQIVRTDIVNVLQRATREVVVEEIDHYGGENNENEKMNADEPDVALPNEVVNVGAEEERNSEIKIETPAVQFENNVEPMVRELRDEKEVNNFQIEAHQYLSDGLVTTYNQAKLAMQLMELQFDRSESIDAAMECSSIQSAITYLQQDCNLCAEKISMKQMISMLECEHKCCQECARQFFTLQITEKNIDNCVCPFCQRPDVSGSDADTVFNYFGNLDILLKTILTPHVHELFQQKLRDRTLMQDPNFKWCPKCSFGFIADEDQRRISCPSCKAISCARCGKLWESEHIGRSCDEYKEWLATQNDNNSRLDNLLEDHGVICPKCNTKFILVKGGCMHLTCTQCKYEFCSDCYKPFALGDDCKVSDHCIKLGLHAHHPRNCLFYLRDKEPQQLKQLLAENNVAFTLKESTDKRCNIPLQTETELGLVDTKCNKIAYEYGLCKIHYVEYLAKLIRKNKIDPVATFDLAEILQEFRRRGKSLPIRGPNSFEHEYRRYCIQMVKEEIPLE